MVVPATGNGTRGPLTKFETMEKLDWLNPLHGDLFIFFFFLFIFLICCINANVNLPLRPRIDSSAGEKTEQLSLASIEPSRSDTIDRMSSERYSKNETLRV